MTKYTSETKCAYSEENMEATTTDKALLRWLCEFAAQKRKAAQKQYTFL
jgi:hypothetical protein